jgi:hypothetical protein
MADEPDNLVLALLRDMRGEMAGIRTEMTGMRAELRSEIASLRADVASDMLTLEKRLRDEFSGLRRSVMEYHSSTIGHGVLLNELEDRVRRLERHVGLAPDTH